MTANTAVTTMPMNRPPRILRATSTPQSRRPTTKTKVGQDAIEPPIPRPTGTVVLAASGRRRTNPESTTPTMAMNRPIPTAIAALRSAGTALNTAVRNPVIARITMMTPSMTMRPMASAQVTCWAIVTATSELMPRPVANANGYRAMAPNAMVITPAVKAVTAAISTIDSWLPSTSTPEPRISGLRMMM